MTDETTQQGVSDPEAQFQGLWDSGAFEPEQQPQPEQEPEPEKAEESPENEQEQAEEGEDPEKDEPEKEEPETYEDLDDFLTSNELNPEDFRSLNVTVKIDGQEQKVPLSDVIKSYQLEGHVNNKSIELSNKQREFEQERQTKLQEFSKHIENAETASQYLVQKLQQDFSSVNWDQLRQEDPAEAASRWQEFQQREREIIQFNQQVEQAKQQQQQAQQEELQRVSQAEREKMLDARPEWRDTDAFRKDASTISEYAKNLGFSDAELNQIVDHRVMLMLHDAARYQALQAAKPTATKRVRQAPKVVKAGTRTNRNPQEVARQTAKERFLKNPSDHRAQEDYFGTFV